MFWYWYFMVLFVPEVIVSQQTGKVDVGLESDTTQPYFSYNENYKFNLTFPVTLYVIDVSTGNEVPNFPSTTVDVFCDVIPSGSYGFSQITVQQQPVVVSQRQVDFMKFSIQSYGRPIVVSCYGVSSSSALFQSNSSRGLSGTLEIRKPGTVSVCSSEVYVYNDTSNTQTFYVELSEVVEFGYVDVNCTTATNTLRLNIQSANVSIGSQTTQVNYKLLQPGPAVTVLCTAWSVVNPGQNEQFIYATSAGRTAQFTIAVGNIHFYPESAHVITETFLPVVQLSPPPKDSSEVTATCTLFVSNDSAAIQDQIKTGVCANNTGGNYWTLDQYYYKFTDGKCSDCPEYYAVIQAIRQSSSQSIYPELVLLCCREDGISGANADASFNGVISSLLFSVDVTPMNPVDWTAANNNVPSFPEPWYVELATCPCDLTQGSCDLNCCCDKECSSSDVMVFNCIQGVYGGQALPTDTLYCSSYVRYQVHEDYWPFLCVQSQNTPVLGIYHAVPQLLGPTQVDEVYQQYKPSYSYRQKPNLVEAGSDSVGYKEGINVKTAIKLEDTALYSADYRLTLPGPTVGGRCEFSVPVRFAHDSDEVCVWPLSANICSSSSSLNANNYAHSSRGGECGRGLLLLKNQREIAVAVTDVNYLCTSTGARYLISDNDQVPKTANQHRTFNVDIIENTCHFDNITGAYKCEMVPGPITNTSTPSRCTFDDGYTDPPQPHYNNITNTCDNVVLQVRYNFTWRGQEVVLLNATVVLGNVSLTETVQRTEVITYYNGSSTGTYNNITSTSYHLYLKQNVSVVFTHELNTTIYRTINDSNKNSGTDIPVPYSNSQYKRSGKQGYIDGLQLKTGVKVLYEGQDSTYVDMNISSQLGVWSKGVFCDSTSRRVLYFQRDVQSGCLLQLNMTDFVDCVSLRKLILNRQDNLMLSDVIGVGGDPYPSDSSQWRSIFRENLNLTLEENSTDDFINGHCNNIPSGIHVDILYSQTGEASGYLTLSVVSARIRYILSNWTYINDPTGVQVFELTSSAAFIRLPQNYQQINPTSWYQRASTRTAGVKVCARDVCPEQLFFYPWLSSYKGETRPRVIAWSALVIVILAAAYIIVAQGPIPLRMAKFAIIWLSIIFLAIIIFLIKPSYNNSQANGAQVLYI